MQLLVEIFYFTTPLLAAGLVHHFLIINKNLVSFLAKPVDFYLTVGNKRLFGNSKTFRGFIAVSLVSAITMWMLSFPIRINLKYAPLVSGAILGLGYSLGELPNSFVKRRLEIKEGQQGKGRFKALFYFFDQTDSIIGSLIALLFIYPPRWWLIFSLFLVGTFLHIIIDLVLYLQGYKRKMEKPFFLNQKTT